MSWQDMVEESLTPSKMREVVKETVNYSGLSFATVMGETRKQPYVKVRQIAMWRLHSELKASASEIARFFRKDHTTVLYALEKMEREHAEITERTDSAQ